MKAANKIKKYLSKTTKQKFTTSLENTENVTNWTKSVNSRVSTKEGKAVMGQLNSLINYYNKAPESSEIPEIDWQTWQSEIVTDGMVSKIQKNLESLMQEEYDVKSIMTKVSESETEVFSALNSELYYHNALWNSFYMQNLEYLVQLRYFPGLDDMNEVERMDYIGISKIEMQRRTETHNYLQGSHEDVNIVGLAESQFNWGKKLHTFWRHPSDDYRDIKATKNILGR